MGKDHGRLCKDDLAERIRSWVDLERGAPFEDFRSVYLDELALIAAGADELPGQRRVDELIEAQGTRHLRPREARELDVLQLKLKGQRRRLVRVLGQLLIRSGGAGHFATVARTLAGPTEELLGDFCPPGQRRDLLGPGWRLLATLDAAQATWVLGEHLGGKQTLPRYGIDALLMGVSRNAKPQEWAVLRRFLDEGSAVERACVLCNGDWIRDAEFTAAYLKLGRDEANVARSKVDREQLRGAMMGAINTRGAPLAKALLMASFRDGRWRAERGAHSWSSHPPGPNRARLLGRLNASEKAELVSQGLAPARLFR